MIRSSKIIILVTIILICLSLLGNKTSFVLKKLDSSPNNLLRLHVIANSNSLSDQSLKRKVRNRVIKASQKLFNNKDITNIQQVRNIIKNNMDYLSQIAQKEVVKKGNNYNVKVKLGKYQFPTRSYSNITLPQGKYQALKIIIGKGEGANWWCVLFPPLCFIDSVDNLSTSEVKLNNTKLEKPQELSVKFKFKLIEYLKQNPQLVKSKLNLAEIFPEKENNSH